MKFIQINLILFFLVIHGFASIDESKFAFMQSLIETGEYEDASLEGERLLRKYKNKDTSMYAISAALMSKNSYLWYNFKPSEKYLEFAEKSWNTLPKDSVSRFDVGLYLADAAFTKNDFFKTTELLNLIQPLINNSSPKNKAWYYFIEAATNASFGNFKQAFVSLENAKNAIEFIEDKSTKVANQFLLLSKKAAINFSFGNISESDSCIKNMELMVDSSNLKKSITKFEILWAKAQILYVKRNYAKAALLYLDAYNALDVSYDHHNKYESLKMSAICSIKAGNLSDYQKLYRRSDMLAFKKPLRSQVFRPGVIQLRLVQLMESGEYSLAITKSNEAMKSFAFLPKTNPYFFDFLKYKADAAEFGGQIADYKQILDSLEKISKNQYGQNSSKYASVMLRKAEYDWKYSGNLTLALNSYKTNFDQLLLKKVHENSYEKVPFLLGYAKVNEYLGKNDSAFVKATEAHRISQINYGRTAPETHFGISSMAYYALNVGKYKESFQMLSTTSNLVIASRYEQDSYYLKSLFLQSGLHQMNGDFAKTNKLLNKAYISSLQKEEAKFYEKCETWEVMAANFLVGGNYFKAGRNLSKAIAAKEMSTNKESFMLIEPFLKKLEMHIFKGDIKDADQILAKIAPLIAKYYEKKSTTQAQLLYLKAQYFVSIADYKKAKDLMNESIDIFGQIFGKNHIRLAPLYQELAKIIYKQDKNSFKNANEQFEKAKDIVKNALGENTPLFANLLTQQSVLLIDARMFTQAGLNLDKSERFWTSQLGADVVQIAEIQFIKGNLNYVQKKYPDGEKAYNKSASLYEELFNKNHNGYLNAKVQLAKIEVMKKNYTSAQTLMNEVLTSRLNYTDNNFSVMSFSQKSNFWAQFKDEFELFYAICYHLIDKKINKNASAEMYNYALKTKGMLLNSDAKIRRQVFESNDSTLIANYNEWLSQKEYFALVSTFSKKQLEEENINLSKLDIEIAELEKYISQATNTNLNEATKTTLWTDITTALLPNEAAVELVRFRKFNHTFTDTAIYAALIISNKSIATPEAVFMTNGKEMETKYLKYYRNSSINKSVDEYSYDVFLKPIKNLIPDNYTVYFAGEGVYMQLNPEMLLNTEKSKYAFENNSYVFVTNTKDILPEEKGGKSELKEDQKKYFIYGNPKFYTSAPKDGKETIPSLAGAEKEVVDIKAILDKNNKSSLNSIGLPVTEDTLRSLKNPYVLHISTHGFFMETPKGKSEGLNNPMLNSGLMLTGSANLLENNEGYINSKPGILTASEVMDLNFSSTNLVVLSACETGRGQIEVGEGVFGLQRAFLVAGAKSIILSLFKVDDDATNLLMVTFYEKFIENGGDYRKAFREAKDTVRKNEKFASPIYWGPFIMVEGKQKRGKIN